MAQLIHFALQMGRMPRTCMGYDKKMTFLERHGLLLMVKVLYIYHISSLITCHFLPLLRSLTLLTIVLLHFISHFLHCHPRVKKSYSTMATMKCKAIGPDCPPDGSSLGYAPNMAASIIFLALFSISLVGHLALGWKYKTWTFLIAMGLGSSSELIGYLGRILMHNNPYKLSTLVFRHAIGGQILT